MKIHEKGSSPKQNKETLTDVVFSSVSASVCAMLLVFGMPSSAVATPLAPAQIFTGVNCLGIVNEGAKNDSFCSETNFFGGFGTGSTFGQAGATFSVAGGGPTPRVSVSASSILNSPVPALLQVVASASVIYEMQVNLFPTGVNDDQPAGPGTSLPFEIPVSISAIGSASVTGFSGDATAGVTIRGTGFGASSPFGDPSFNESGPLFLRVGQPTTVTMSANCDVLATDIDPIASCNAEADPAFFFDETAQSAFDDFRGRQFLPTFDLATFYGFEFSEGISGPVSPVPLPAALPLFLTAVAGLGGFGFMRRRRKAA